MDIKNKILNCFAIAFISLLFLFAFTWIIFDFQSHTNALKDTWSIVSSLFGGISTLVAAYIASLLFNDWKDQHNKEIRNNFALKIYDCYISLTSLILDFGLQIEAIQPPKKTYIPFLATKESQNLLNEFKKLNQQYDQINIQISYLFDRIREHATVIKQEDEINLYILEYLKIYDYIIESDISEAKTIEEIISIYKNRYEKYKHLRDLIYSLTISPLLCNLEVHKNY